MKTIRLNNGVEMPALGFGVFRLSPAECERCVLDAIETGYRSIDTAQDYQNEEGVGAAISKCGIPRDQLFITTKVWISNAGGQRDVAFYADRLCITPKYLSQVSKSVSGLPASEWISFYSAYELVSLLNDHSKTLTEVADLMHFETLSHFSRYTKKLLGKSPTEYRKN